jgi:hypothetical protein
MSNSNLKQWALKFRKDAEADEFSLFRGHLRKLGLPDKPELLLEGTIQVVIACAAYASLDGQSHAAFLNMQRYDPAEAGPVRYAFTFDIFGKASGRVLVATKAAIPDLADLYGHPWQDYRVCGYRSVFVSRIDNKNLGMRELARLEKEITYDLRFDLGEDEIDFWFDSQSVEGVLRVGIQDHFALQEGDGNESEE